MTERLNTTFSRRTSSKRRMTNIANRFEQIKGELNAQQTVQSLRDDMRDALSKFGEINELLWPLLEAAEVSAADRTTMSHTASEDISDSDQYITGAEDTLFERTTRHWSVPLRPSQLPRPPAPEATIFLYVFVLHFETYIHIYL